MPVSTFKKKHASKKLRITDVAHIRFFFFFFKAYLREITCVQVGKRQREALRVRSQMRGSNPEMVKSDVPPRRPSSSHSISNTAVLDESTLCLYTPGLTMVQENKSGVLVEPREVFKR